MTDIQPLSLHTETVREAWIDYNGHMNVAYYVLTFDNATDAFFDHIGLDAGYRARTNCTTFAVEGHITYDREVKLGDPLRFTTQLLGFDQKRIHFFHCMYHADEGYLASTTELMSLHVDAVARKTTPLHAEIMDNLAALWETQKQIPRPPQVGRSLSLTGKRAS